jgi:hypothetical protein
MTALTIALADAADQVLTLLGHEPIIYLPRGGGAVALEGLIERDVPVVLSNGRQVAGARMTLRNDATRGIASPTIDTGGDRVRWLPKRGRPERTSRIVRVAQHDAGCVIIEVA